MANSNQKRSSELEAQILQVLDGNPQSTTELYRVLGTKAFHEQQVVSGRLTDLRKAGKVLLCKRAGRFGGQTQNLWHLPNQEPPRSNYKAST